MPRLVKFCRPEHNLSDGCRTIRIGTLDFYRELDPKFMIADPTEGLESTVVRSLSMETATRDAADAIKRVVRLPYVEVHNIAFRNTFPNSYVWCCSRLPDGAFPITGSRFDSMYESSYEVTDDRHFADHLAALILKHVRRRNFSETVQSKIDDLPVFGLRDINLFWKYREVLYVDQKTSVVEEGRLHPHVADIEAAFRPVFVKPNKFIDDREYRFLFWFEHPQLGILPVAKQPLDVPILPIAPTSVALACPAS